jgi:hypothetical protein
MPLTTYNHVPIPSFMYGTAWKKEATTHLVQLAVETATVLKVKPESGHFLGWPQNIPHTMGLGATCVA